MCIRDRSEPVLEVSNVSQPEEVAVMPEVERLSIEEQPVPVSYTHLHRLCSFLAFLSF